MSDIKANLEDVRTNITNAALRAGRKPSDIKLIAVSKTKPVEDIREAVDCGIMTFGENRVQELTDKISYFDSLDIAPEWHLIGHLQTNKCKYIVGKTSLIHSVDSYRLADELNRESVKKSVITDILIEINIGNEESKFGVKPEGCEALIREIAVLPNIRIMGLMCVAPFTENPESNRGFFRQMKNLSVDIASKNIDNVNMCELSMGMTGDYQIAIEEGATMVRVGTGIFGQRNYQI